MTRHGSSRFLAVTSAVIMVLGILSCGRQAGTAPTTLTTKGTKGWSGPNLTGTWSGTLGATSVFVGSRIKDVRITFAASGSTMTGQFQYPDHTSGSIVLTDSATLGGILTITAPFTAFHPVADTAADPGTVCIGAGPISGVLSGEVLRFVAPLLSETSASCEGGSWSTDLVFVLRRENLTVTNGMRPSESGTK